VLARPIGIDGGDRRGLGPSGTTKIPAGFTLPLGTAPQVVVAIAYALARLLTAG